LYAAGEVASTGVHGANRLASNSLLEALVFGGRAAAAMKQEKGIGSSPRIGQSGFATSVIESANPEIRDITWRHAGIVRNAEGLRNGLMLLSRIAEESNLLTVSRIIHECALAREESRGAHYREDFPTTTESKLHSYVRKDAGVQLL
jgi:L-aspartate oxidase